MIGYVKLAEKEIADVKDCVNKYKNRMDLVIRHTYYVKTLPNKLFRICNDYYYNDIVYIYGFVKRPSNEYTINNNLLLSYVEWEGINYIIENNSVDKTIFIYKKGGKTYQHSYELYIYVEPLDKDYDVMTIKYNCFSSDYDNISRHPICHENLVNMLKEIKKLQES